MILVGQNEVVMSMVSAITGSLFEPSMSQAIGLLRGGSLVGGVVFTSVVKGCSCEMSVAGLYPGWVTREFIYAAFHYPFIQQDLIKVLGLVRSTNHTALAFDTKLGFRLETKVADVYGPGVDCIVMSMRREECRWLPAAEKWFAKVAA